VKQLDCELVKAAANQHLMLFSAGRITNFSLFLFKRHTFMNIFVDVQKQLGQISSMKKVIFPDEIEVKL